MPSFPSDQPYAHIAVEGELTIYRANELKQTLLAALDGADALAIDLSGVTEIDSAGVQLLMMASASAREAGCELRLSGHSCAVREVFDLLDLARYFNDPLLAPSSIGSAPCVDFISPPPGTP